MLLGAPLHIYTDHRNLTYSTLNSNRVLRWRLFLEEYDATYHYFPGKLNTLADAFSRLPRIDSTSSSEGKSPQTSFEEHLFFAVPAEPELVDCFLNLPETDEMRNPLHVPWIQANQFEDVDLNTRSQESP